MIMKIRPYIAAVSVFGFLLLPLLVDAATPPTKDYLLASSTPFIRDLDADANIADYLQAVFNLGMGLAVTLAILMIVLNGIKYMVSDAIGDKIAAKDIIKNALIGLLIIFGSVIVLNTINPQLTQFNLQATIDKTIAAIQAHQPGGADYEPPPIGDTGAPWPSDAAERSRLEAADIDINKANCTTIGQKNCTSVHGLTNGTIERLMNLKTNCEATQKTSCNIMITGGTEYWLHSRGGTHGDGDTVDISSNPTLDTYIGGTGTKCGDVRGKDLIQFKWEDSSCPWSVTGTHWHAVNTL
jgi:hypothetical protein